MTAVGEICSFCGRIVVVSRRWVDMDCKYTNYTIFSACFQLLFSPNFSDRSCRKYSIQKRKNRKVNIFLQIAAYRSLHTLFSILAFIFLEFNRISVNSRKKFPIYIVRTLSASTVCSVCFCRKKKKYVVKSSKNFVFFPQTSRFFCISHCTFSIKKGKKLRKSLAKRLQV